MKLKKYSKYKDSWIDWIWEIPEGWNVRRLKFINKLQWWYAFKSEKFSEEWNDIIRIWDIKDNVNFDNAKKYPESIKIHKDFKIKNNDVLIALTWATIWKVWKVNNYSWKAYINQRVGKISWTNNYYYYLLKSDFIKKQIELIWDWSAQENISNWQIEDFFIPFNGKQEIISSFLDSKTSQIENLIKKDKKMIELLKEKRVSLINKSVTKGLDDSVEMKDSWVQWIWKIPEDSDLVLFRRICNVNQWYQIAQELRLEEQENKSKIYITIRYLNSKWEWIKEYILNPPKSVCCKKEDVIMARTWSTWQIVSGVEWVFHNNFFKINYNKKKVNNKYLVYYLEQKLIKNILLLKAGVTTIPDLNHDSFLETPFILHSYEKQEKIVIFLDKKTKKIDNHIKKVEERIKLYEEYKKSLIYNVVTGKVEA